MVAGRTQGRSVAGAFQPTQLNTAGKIVACGKVSINLPSIGAGASGVGTATLTGLLTTDMVIVTPSSDLNTALVFQGAKVSVADTLQVRVRNESAGAIDDVAIDYYYLVIR